jgi:murein L,D-transpeptidase YcbB/YkuD
LIAGARSAWLAEWMLSDEPDWQRDRIVEAMQGSESIDVKLSRHIQLVTVYVTAVVLENDEVHFFEDIYGKDGAPDEQLAETSGAQFTAPTHGSSREG